MPRSSASCWSADRRISVRLYVYPMVALNLGEWQKSAAATGWEWSETNGWVSGSQLRRAPPLGYFLVPMRVPVEA